METNNQLGRIRILLIFLAVAILAGIVVVFVVSSKKIQEESHSWDGKGVPDAVSRNLATLKKFKSEEEFKKYLAQSASAFSYMAGGRGGGPVEALAQSDSSQAPKSNAAGWAESSPESPDRFSQTNVQTAGIDEPDILKTDGKEIFFSTNEKILSAAEGRSQAALMPVPRENAVVKNIRAYPASDLALDAQIAKGGELLLKDNILIVLPEKYAYYGSSERRVYGYDVSDPAAPKEKWSAQIKGKAQVEAVRLQGSKIYIVMSHTLDKNRPCPTEVMSIGGKTHSAVCTDIFHPAALVPADVTYSVTALSAENGAVEDIVSFVGSSSDSVVYMSEKSLYITYYYPGDFLEFALDFFRENRDLTGDDMIQSLEKLKTYQIGGNAKMTEYYDILERRFAGMDADEEAKIKNDLANRMDEYFKKNKRNLEKTGIVKIGLPDLNLEGSGTVTGKPLNQFSLDEYKGNLRVATTVGNNWWWFGFGSGGARESANDVYVLDASLRVRGEITDLGLEEKIYSARFIEDKGYLVTFKQIDPFFVLDLADPEKPKKSGELKIPGYSSYLHPVAKDRILGVGEENSKVKATLFDVSDAENPRELATYRLEEYWSEAVDNHHAFLQDAKHEIFFLPGSSGGYVLSYSGDKLELKKAVSEIRARRAVFINDYLYVIGDDKIVVLDEKNWERVGELEL